MSDTPHTDEFGDQAWCAAYLRTLHERFETFRDAQYLREAAAECKRSRLLPPAWLVDALIEIVADAEFSRIAKGATSKGALIRRRSHQIALCAVLATEFDPTQPLVGNRGESPGIFELVARQFNVSAKTVENYFYQHREVVEQFLKNWPIL
jgi:hypothetical protein